MESVYIAHPLSLGDYFVCNSLVIDQLRRHQEIHLPVAPQFLDTVKCLYSDHNNIRIIPYLGDLVEQNYIHNLQLPVVYWRVTPETVKFHFHEDLHAVAIAINYDRQLYEQLDCSFSKRYTNFQLPEQIPNSQDLFNKLNPTNEPYVLWHKYTSKHVGGLPIGLHGWRLAAGLPDKKIIEVELGQTTNMLDYMKLIERADEIHCVHSSFYQLVDSVCNKTQAQLFYHDYRRDIINQINCAWNNHKWIRVEYLVKI